ncbi:uncharacterized protein AC631_00551 [Debaryomyces fabryi]|uniref:Protein kinase domain-containing protein n=1 Tax=Debaryomyces fabryi TaxID=58627 RepID=A0A0V1Q5F5_9ASCO|nr:uncharacterized protein AC631_00551 [Debaryomyces fabryi]KSA03739.1 hypothetical protein AC631_00551 [Debaryomyces fabryi]CUM53310.1 unnamed protein product [Debaryomyces fabryi]
MGDMVSDKTSREKRSGEERVKEKEKEKDSSQNGNQNGGSGVQMSVGDELEEEDGIRYGDLPAEYRLVHKLGEGAFSAVYKAVYEPTGRLVAIKIINKANLSGKQIANIHNEISIMKRLSHPNVLRLVDLFNNDKHCYIVLEYCDGGEIFNKIIEYTYFSEDLSRFIFSQLLSAVDYLHSINIAHRDIKPENLLFNTIPFHERPTEEFEKHKRTSDDNTKVDEGEFVGGVGGGGIGIIKLADFGLAKQLRPSNTMGSNLKTPCGTAGYTAPEVITCNGTKMKRFPNKQSQKHFYSKAVDIWSLGCFLYTILCGFPPFYDDDHHQLTLKILNGDYVFLKPWWDEVSLDAKDLICKMLTINPDDRITIKEIWNHPWIKDHYGPQSPSYFDSCDAEHVEYSGEVDHLNPMDISKNGSNSHFNADLMSPRAEAIKKVFNNPAMSNSRTTKFKLSASSVQFTLDNLQDLLIHGKKTLPKSPLPSKKDFNKLTFKDVFDGNKTVIAENKAYEEDSEEEEDSIDDLDESSDELNDELTSLDKFSVKQLESQRSSLKSNSSDDENSLHDDYNEDYQTRSSSIISGINGDYKFTLNLNDSNLLRRRSSTVKSNKSLPAE